VWLEVLFFFGYRKNLAHKLQVLVNLEVARLNAASVFKKVAKGL
jgi:hypothetical protein